MMTDETKRVTRAELAEAIGDQHWGWLAWTDADTNNPRALRAFRNVADAIFDALPADPPASAGHNHAGDFCDPLTCPWRPASADVDAAREALLEAVPSDWGRARVRAFEAAIRAEGLDVERLAEAIRGAMLEAGLGSGVSLGVPERIAPLIVARLAEAER